MISFLWEDEARRRVTLVMATHTAPGTQPRGHRGCSIVLHHRGGVRLRAMRLAGCRLREAGQQPRSFKRPLQTEVADMGVDRRRRDVFMA